MKKIKILLLFVLIVLLQGASACKKEAAEEELEIYSYDELDANELIIANDELELHFDPNTTHFYVVVKDTGYIWYSNPQDTVAGAPGFNDLNSTLTLRYSTVSTTATLMDNYAYSIMKGNYLYKLLGDNGIEINYTVADIDKTYLFPVAVPESRFRQFFDKMEKSLQRQVSEYYKKYDINKVRDGEDKDELLKKYPDYANEIIYEVREITNTAMKQRIEDAFVAAGYTLEDYEADLARYQTTIKTKKPQFNITVQYFLEGKELVVKVPLEKIAYKENYPIVELRMLPYFGSGGVTADGFLLIPDGSGAIINFNNGKQSQRMYKSDLYGWDYAISRDAVKDETRANMPVFGISNGSSSFICTLEEGNAHAFLEADVSGRMHDYNYACSNYYLIRNEMLDISAKSITSVRMFQKNLPSEVLTQRYIFLDTSDYSSMAVAYREYLMDLYPQLKKMTKSDVPVAVELIGAVDRTRHVIGIPTRQPDELTSYKEAREIVEELLSNGITNLSIKYNGWFNDGILHKAPNKVKLISELGSKKDFKKLVEYTRENGVNLYLEATFQFVYNNSMFDNFMRIRDGAKYVNRKIVDLMPYSTIFYGKADWLYEYNLAKPGYYLKNIDAYARGIEKLGVKNIAFTDIGKTLSADYDDKKEVSREAVRNLQEEKLSELYEDGYGIMLNNANMYAIPYADFIVDVNLSSKRYNIIDDEIPFMEIVLHGLIPYAGTAINLANDYERNLLKTAEYGAGLYYIFMAAESFEIANSRYTKYFSSDFNTWAEETIELYKKMQNDFGHLYNQYITEHRKLAKGVYMTVYEDGTRVIVNYNESAYSYDNKEIPAKDYIVEGGRQ